MTSPPETAETRPLAVVTGAASGIGFEVAKVFAQSGFDLLIMGKDNQIREAAKAFRDLGAQVEIAQIDLASRDGVDLLYQKIITSGRPVDSISLNPWVEVRGPFIKTDLKAELNLIQANIVSLVHLAKHIVQDMVALGRGRIFISSPAESEEKSAPHSAVSAASKSFMQAFAEILKNEVKDSGVIVEAVQLLASERS